MVTAIVIPIICMYFFWLTKKEVKAKEKEWLNVVNINEEAILSGEILTFHNEKQRFYYNRYILVQELKLHTETRTCTAKKLVPLKKNTPLDSFKPGETVKLFGKWEEQDFLFSRFEKILTKD